MKCAASFNMKQRNIIGLVGFIGSGKNTVADYLVSTHDFQSVSFAGHLKDAVAAIFGWPRYLLEGNTGESRIWREQSDPYWSEKLNMVVTPRWVLQHLGTDVLRHHFADDLWIWSLEKVLRFVSRNYVVTDVRFPNEIKMIRSLMGGEIWWVQRGMLPEWINTATNHPELMSSMHPMTHSSEYAWLSYGDFKIIDNDVCLNSLYDQIDQLYLLREKPHVL
jgi:ABC-type uncharacterized transport system ATPase subunit